MEKLLDESLFARIARIPLLTARQEQELGRRMEEGDEAARGRLIEHNLRLVVGLAVHRKKHGHTLELDDLVSEGTLGLIRAVELWDRKRGLKFSTYATPWIKQAMQRAGQNTGRTIRLPVNKEEVLARVRRAEGTLIAEGNHYPSVEQVAEAAEAAPEEVELVLKNAERLASLDKPLDSDEDEATIGSLVSDPDGEAALEYVLDQDAVVRGLDTLPERLQTVISLRFGAGLTLKEVGDMLGVSRERVRQLEDDGLERLRSVIPPT